VGIDSLDVVSFVTVSVETILSAISLSTTTDTFVVAMSVLPAVFAVKAVSALTEFVFV